MLTDEEAAFLRARLDEDEAGAQALDGETWAAETDVGDEYNIGIVVTTNDLIARCGVEHMQDGELRAAHIARHDPARALADVGVWRRLLLEYSIPPGTDAVYGGTEREKGFRLALSFALKAKAATYSDHPDYPGDRQPGYTQVAGNGPHPPGED